ncbi:hypothetical protein HBI56_085240 [Parastagonospora nodorum]|uniref:Uncharacterized protein n=2 Tax=Phaeosphaeria nodorum (strain SN15 / ATCC MYA-4574 / FGSC 10173) TaxID=321614 RepID=A0A7U2FHP3_PHANO|nr:hypothetical protein SNOG_10405 [Parastagonospora nodorum SN15]KAH3913303.1 hypothetical protein HBH56_101340 [Parastagonospora nodorum]EAT81799.1 hypothetical protein SNOG_10405 [Parastagonospora nodorum SN15]KAH3929304.1 hypothetical protein HBH54_129090 [Parastagonospora nodorum]KAH3951398.1 hypothetical protein HBH53_063100 [Parastagonospora nodorum]KAH3975417.1 hypothetical protein HBH52_123770 [Parastagonospora nodorum]
MGESLSKLIINSLKTTIKTLCSDEANQATFNRIAEVDPEAGQRAHPCIASRLANSLDVVELQPKTTARLLKLFGANPLLSRDDM